MRKPSGQISEADFEQTITNEVDTAGRVFAEGEKRLWGSESSTWTEAAEIVKQVRPVPWVFWIMIRAVYGRHDEKKVVDPMTFSLVENLMFRAAHDPFIAREEPQEDMITITAVSQFLSVEVCASLCFIHAVSKRVSTFLNQRIFRAIIDDALIRARLGCCLGAINQDLGIGAPMLAGFVGRAGLAIQLASGSDDKARDCLNSLATGQHISDIGTKIYGCDPLQVAALALVQGGCSKEMAVGVSSYSLPSDEIVPLGIQSKWFSMFTILENARVQTLADVKEEHWVEVGFDETDRYTFSEDVKNILRRGHRFDWILSSLSEMYDKDADKKKES